MWTRIKQFLANLLEGLSDIFEGLFEALGDIDWGDIDFD